MFIIRILEVYAKDDAHFEDEIYDIVSYGELEREILELLNKGYAADRLVILKKINCNITYSINFQE